MFITKVTLKAIFFLCGSSTSFFLEKFSDFIKQRKKPPEGFQTIQPTNFHIKMKDFMFTIYLFLQNFNLKWSV